MKNYLKQTLFCTVFLSGFLLWGNAMADCTGSSPTWTSTPDRASVATCVSNASPEDTINVTAGDGTETWTSALVITKGINLIGPGMTNLTITNGTSGNYIIRYEPAAGNYQYNYTFRLSGFKFDANGGTGCLMLGEYGMIAPFTLQTKVRIDHNHFHNSSSTDAKGQAIFNPLTTYGVIDNNIFTGMGYPTAHSGGNPESYGWWSNSPQNIFAHGGANYTYWEDNTFTLETLDGGDNCMTDGEYASRYVFRYNTITNHTDSYSLFEQHGQQGTEMPASFGVELYGNEIAQGSNDLTFFRTRSGQSLVFMNTATGSTTPLVDGYTGGLDTCPNDAYVAQKVTHNTYYFNNRQGLTGDYFDVSVDTSGRLTCNGLSNIPTLGRDIFGNETSPGVSCGTVANRPGTCTVGQGYWATNQSCTNLTGMVGTNPSTPISGTLYKCTATNVWTEFYTPYTYPHPLRTEATDAVAPASPTGLAVT